MWLRSLLLMAAWMGLCASASAQAATAEAPTREPAPRVELAGAHDTTRPQVKLNASFDNAASAMASAALRAARVPLTQEAKGLAKGTGSRALSLEGKPGDVRLICSRTDVMKVQRWIVPKVPLPPFYRWNRFLDKWQDKATHTALDWMDEHGKWWHTEVRGYKHHAAEYRVGEGEFQGTGVTVYGVFILPGRSDPEGKEVLLDEKVECDHRIIEREARKYGRKNKRPGDPGTGGRGKENVGLGGPAFKPSQCSNTYTSYLLRKAGVRRESPQGALGWDTIPHFPYSSDADAYDR